MTRYSNSTATFRYDATLLEVTDTVPPVGSTFDPPGPASYTLDLNFNEAVDPASVQTGDLHLSGIPGSTVTNVQIIDGDTRRVHDSDQQHLLRHVNGEPTRWRHHR